MVTWLFAFSHSRGCSSSYFHWDNNHPFMLCNLNMADLRKWRDYRPTFGPWNGSKLQHICHFKWVWVWCTLRWLNIAIEHGSCINDLPVEMVIFHSYVSLPEGKRSHYRHRLDPPVTEATSNSQNSLSSCQKTTTTTKTTTATTTTTCFHYFPVCISEGIIPHF